MQNMKFQLVVLRNLVVFSVSLFIHGKTEASIQSRARTVALPSESALLARPVFGANRRGSSNVKADNSPSIVPRVPRLTGIIRIGLERRCLFVLPDSGEVVVVVQGESVDGFVVLEVGSESVTLAKGDSVFTEGLSFDPNLIASEPSYLQLRPSPPAQ